MTTNSPPIVSIGLPVYNGERYLRKTLESLLEQSYQDFELIISDNASTDSTPLICKEYAERDQRISYHRFEKNMGAARNYNYVFEVSRGKFFKWAAHDDLCAPEFIARCVDALERDHSTVLAYPKVTIIDADGKAVEEYDEGKALESDSPYERFASLIFAPGECNAVFGLIRSDVLAKTQLIGVYVSSDRNLLAELALWGRFHEVPENYFFRREHIERPLYMAKTDTEKVIWFDPSKNKSIVLTVWRQNIGYVKSVTRVPMKLIDKIYCYYFIAKLVSWNWRIQLWELRTAFAKLMHLAYTKLGNKLRGTCKM